MADDQAQTIAFLLQPRAFGQSKGKVQKIETHGALVFLCADQAIKLKRSVVYDYMDLGTADKRHALLLRELELNQPIVPSIYRDVVPITREPDGVLAVDGKGAPVDWVLRMNRFDAQDELVNVAMKGALDDPLATQLGHALAAYHRATPVRKAVGSTLITEILDELDHIFPGLEGAEPAKAWSLAARKALARVAPLLDRRANQGAVRRCHGDLHLRNLVLIDGTPVPFDALEFDERLATCDLLYDLGFLLMDLCHRNLRRAGCRVLESWLSDFDGAQDGGLAALPLFMSVRASIRAMVLLQSDVACGRLGESRDEAALYLRQANAFLTPPPPICIAIGGYSGTGKSHLARALAPRVGAAPGAIWLASDVVRKASQKDAGRLPATAYTKAARDAVYDQMRQRAGAILQAGHSVILDATFLDPQQRMAAQDLAHDQKVAFAGLWLEAPEKTLRNRIEQRRGNASDADLSVLQRQLAKGAGDVTWNRINTQQTAENSLCDAMARIPAKYFALD